MIKREKARKNIKLKSGFRLTLFLILILILSIGVFKYLGKDRGKLPLTPHKEDYPVSGPNKGEEKKEAIIPVKQGIITIESRDETTDGPIKNAEYTILNLDTNKLIEVLVTDNRGTAVSAPIDYGISCEIWQTDVPLPYKINDEKKSIIIGQDEIQIENRNIWREYIKDIEPLEDGDIKVREVNIPLETLMQNPELPNGCEITSLTAVLNYYGFDAEKTVMADDYLPKVPFYYKGKKLYGADPNKAYAGDPRLKQGGFFSYAPPIVEAADNYFNDYGGGYRPLDISLSQEDEIISYLKEGVPVVIWVTLDLTEPRINYSWYFHETGEYFDAPVNLHCVVLNGYKDDDSLHVMNPLKGQVVYDRDYFFRSYEALGRHAMVVLPESKGQ